MQDYAFKGRGGEGRVRAKARALLDYDTAYPPEGGPAEAGDRTASSLPVLDGAGLQDLMCAPHICHCLPPDRTQHKVNDPKVDYSGSIGEGKVGHEPKLEPCWTLM